MNGVAGIVLCGGQSNRMGQPKAWLRFGDEFMLQRAVRLLSEAVSPIVVVAAPAQDLPPLAPDVTVARDPVSGRGPMQGLAAGLAALPVEAHAAYVSSCDVPLLFPAFVRRMIELFGDHMACVPRIDGQLHPLAAIYRRDVRAVADQLLTEGRFRLTTLFDLVPTHFASADDLQGVDPDLRSLRNLNMPDDYTAAVRLWRQHPH